MPSLYPKGTGSAERVLEGHRLGREGTISKALPLAREQQLCCAAFGEQAREQYAERQRAADEQHVGERHLLHGHDDAEVIGGAGNPVEQERMYKGDEHGVGGEHADGLVDEGGGGAPLSRLTATAPLKGSLSFNYTLSASYNKKACRLTFP